MAPETNLRFFVLLIILGTVNTSDALFDVTSTVNTRDTLSSVSSTVHTSDTLSDVAFTANTSDGVSDVTPTTNTSDTLSDVTSTTNTSDTLSDVTSTTNTSDTLSDITSTANTSDTLSDVTSTANTRDTLYDATSTANTSATLSDVPSTGETLSDVTSTANTSGTAPLRDLVPTVLTSRTGSRLNLTPEFLVDCLLQSRREVPLPALDGELFFDLHKLPLTDEVLTSENHCTMSLLAPSPDRMMLLKFSSSFRVGMGRLLFYVSETGDEEHLPPLTFNVVGKMTALAKQWNRKATSSPGDKVWFMLQLDDRANESFPVALNFSWVKNSLQSTLETAFLSNTSGYIQTENFDGVTQSLLPRGSQWAHVSVPVGFTLLVSFFHLHCWNPAIMIYLDFKAQSILACSFEVSQTFPAVFETSTLDVAVIRYSIYALPILGFKLLFTFLDESSAVPQRTGKVRWNCSVSNWPELRQHFGCNVVIDCADGRDEKDCNYSSPQCEAEQFSVGDKCFLFVQQVGNKTESLAWNKADEDCRRRGGYLASLNTAEEWSGVMDILHLVSDMRHVFIGLRSSSTNLPQIYRHTWQHSDGSIAYYIRNTYTTSYGRPACARMKVYKTDFIFNLDSQNMCVKSDGDDYVCEFPKSTDMTDAAVKETEKTVELQQDTPTLFKSVGFVTCPQGHVTHTFLACDPQTACWGQYLSACSAPLSSLPPSFSCTSGLQHVPFTLVCDFRSDCSDHSDEDFCVNQPCDPIIQFRCRSGECLAYEQVCDDIPHCWAGDDEERCGTQITMPTTTITSPAVVRFNGSQMFELIPLNVSEDGQSWTCPLNHFACPATVLCLPVFTRCNDVYDCPGREDEVGCASYTCPGLYRCRGSRVCVSSSEICDGTVHCAQRDDELLCASTCPSVCTCHGLAFFCPRLFAVGAFPQLTYLDASGSGLGPGGAANNTRLVHLKLAQCRLADIVIPSLPNLQHLDLSDNLLREITAQHLEPLPNLMHLSLRANPLASMFTQQTAPPMLSSRLLTLDLSSVRTSTFVLNVLAPFPQLHVLNLSGCGVDTLEAGQAGLPSSLRVLDVRGSKLDTFPAALLRALSHLQQVWADNSKLCCPQSLPPGFNLVRCTAPSDEISSCQNLLRSNLYRGSLAVFACLALLGNLTAFVSRALWSKAKNGFDVLNVTLCVSDFLMGVYLAIIVAADQHYLSSYLSNEATWRHSAPCKMAGFLSMLSHEVSALVVCLITLDRFLVLRFPFSTVRFHRKSGILVSSMVGLVGAVLAAVPLLPVTAHWRYYSLNGICVPLPITRKDFPGRHFSFGLLVVFNFVLFLLIAVGQLFIYTSVQRNSMLSSHETKRASKDHTLARRLFAVAVSDFLCWFPIGLVGIMSSSGFSISGEVNVAMAIFVLPLNSAINPFLYTVNTLLEKQRVRKEERLINMLMKQLKAHPA